MPWESFLVVDSFGSTIGLTKFEVEGRLVAAGKPPQGDYRVLVDFASLLSQSVSRDVALTLRELSRRRYDGTFADFLSRGLLAFREKRWKEAQEYLEQALDRVALDQPEEDEDRRILGIPGLGALRQEGRLFKTVAGQ